jgi:hypothetical protein
MIAKVGLVCLVSLMVANCAAPAVSPNPTTSQAKPSHVVDWKALAEQATANFATVYQTQRPTVFVAPGPADMPFAITYKSDLEMALIHRGFSIAQSAPGAVVLSFEVQTFLYGRDTPYPPRFANTLSPTRAEALVTLTVSDGAHLLYSDSQPFYVRPADIVFYKSRIPAYSPQSVTASTPIPTVSLQIRNYR